LRRVSSQRLADLQVCLRARGTAQLDDGANGVHLVEQRVVRELIVERRVPGEMDTRWRALADLDDEIRPHVFGKERHHGRDKAGHLHEAVPEGLVRGILVRVVFRLPEP
jgi:hypothetical protein